MLRQELPVPANKEAEEGVLACLLFNPRKVMRVVEVLKPHHFLSDDHQSVYEAILAVYGQRGQDCTLFQIADELRRRNLLERIGGQYRLDELANSLLTLGEVQEYADSVIASSKYRRLIQAGMQIARLGYGQESGAVEQAERLIAEIALEGDARPMATFAEGIDRYMRDYEQRRQDFKKGILPGISTGFRDLDFYTGGLQRGELTILAARPSIGKTSIALNVALNMIRNARHVGFFSLEMKERALIQRLLSMDTSIDQAFLRDGDTDDDQDALLHQSARRLRPLDLKMEDRAFTLADIRSKALRTHTRKRLDLIVLDYLQLMDTEQERRRKNGTRTEELGELSKGLKRLAGDLDVPILVLAQLNREGAKSELPQLHHINESGKIEQDADNVLFLHIDMEQEKNREESKPYCIDVLIRKQRNGRLANAQLMFRPRITRFDNVAHEPQETRQPYA